MSFIIGLDGGGTKTAGLLCDGLGHILASAKTVGTAIVGHPSPHACRALDSLVDRLCGEAGMPRRDVAHVGLGLSGVDFADEIPIQHDALRDALKLRPDQLELVNDSVTALWGVSHEERVAIVQHGTAVTSAYRTALGREILFDGLDVASVYDLRRDGFAQTARMIDGRAERTGLADRMLAHCGVSAVQFAEWVFRNPDEARSARAASASVVFGAWQDGDNAAAAMIARAARDYALTVRAMSAHMGRGAFAAAFGGGLIVQGGSRFQDLLAQTLADICPAARLAMIKLRPEAGAVLLAAHSAGRDISPLFDGLERQFASNHAPT